jgi:4-amino-4-deoxy-L-arabinose transferase-like glycosyltransferase
MRTDSISTTEGADKPRDNNAKRRFFALALIGVLALALRLYYVETAVVDKPLRGDATQYFTYAWNVVHHGIFSKAALNDAIVPAADNYRDPGYPLLLAICLKVTSSMSAWYRLVLWIQALLGSMTIMLLICAGRRWIPDRWAIGAGMLMAAWPHSVTLTGYLLSETTFGFLCALAIFCFVRATRKNRVSWSVAAGLVFGAASLTNAILLPFGPLLAGLMAWRSGARRGVLAALAVSATALPLAWGLRNMQLPPGDSSRGRAIVNLVQGSWPEYHSIWFAMSNGDAQARETMGTLEHEFDVMQADPTAGLRLVSDRMRIDPMRYVRWYLSKPALLWGWSIRIGEGDIYVFPTFASPFSNQPVLRAWTAVCRAINPLLMLLALGGCITQLGRNEAASGVGLVLAAIAVYVTLVYSLLQSEPRYSVPFRGLEILLSTSFAWTLTRWVTARRQAALIADSAQTVP